MVAIEWTGKSTVDPETFSTVFQAKVSGKSVSVYVSQEAIDDHGVDAAKGVAEAKIRAEMKGDVPPVRVQV
jgi:hypothetical protein